MSSLFTSFFRQLRYQEFDIAELSLSSYTLTLNQENPPFIALPIFPSRFFRHQSIYVSKRANIKKPSDLRGKRAGCPEWQVRFSNPTHLIRVKGFC
jgi:4,5-dihydroxyphthalate decarboxylase